MNGWDIAILIMLAAAVGVALYFFLRKRKSGKSCCGDCNGCSGCPKGSEKKQ